MDNIRDFILPAEVIDPEDAEKTRVARKPSNVEYSIVFASGPDFAVRRKTKMSSKVLVCLVSQSQYYLKDEKDETIEQFSPDAYAKFMASAPDRIALKEDAGSTCNWLHDIERGKSFGEVLQNVFRLFDCDESTRLAATHDLLQLDGMHYFNGRTIGGDIPVNESVIKKVISICQEFFPAEEVKTCFTRLVLRGDPSSGKLGSAISSLLHKYTWGYGRGIEPLNRQNCGAELLMDAYGISGLEEFLREYFRVGVQAFPSFTSLYGLFNTCECHGQGHLRGTTPILEREEKRVFNLRDFKHYVWYQSVYQGYATDINNFMISWADSLRMQEIIYGKIKEKYPENLASCEKKLSYKFIQIKQKVDEDKWNATVEFMKPLEYKGKIYSIICPKTATDVVDEAQQQSNCVASYVERIIRGECLVFFCRRTDAPETSLVTIELCANGALGQVKARFNRTPSEEIRDFVDKWYNKVVLASDVWERAA